MKDEIIEDMKMEAEERWETHTEGERKKLEDATVLSLRIMEENMNQKPWMQDVILS